MCRRTLSSIQASIHLLLLQEEIPGIPPVPHVAELDPRRELLEQWVQHAMSEIAQCDREIKELRKEIAEARVRNRTMVLCLVSQAIHMWTMWRHMRFHDA